MSNILNKNSHFPLPNSPHSKESIPCLGFGTYLLSSDEAESAVAHALANGYRHIDTAEFYNNHEGIRSAIAASGISREELFITDKLSPGGYPLNLNPAVPQKTYEETLETIQHHLKRLQTTYIDLFLLHHAYPRQERINQYRGLLEAQKQGWIREVGVSNWNIRHIEEIKAAGLPLPAINQIEIHPLATQQELVKYCQYHGIVIVAYSSLAPLASWRESTDRQRAAKKSSEVVADGVERLNSYLTRLCDQRFHKKTPSQILLRWALQHNFPILPKSAQVKRIIENGELFDEDFILSEEEMYELDTNFNENRTFAWPSGNPLLLAE